MLHSSTLQVCLDRECGSRMLAAPLRVGRPMGAMLVAAGLLTGWPAPAMVRVMPRGVKR